MRNLLRDGWRLFQRGRCVLWLALVFAFVLPAFSVSFTASLDRNTIVLGEQAVLTLRCEDGQPQGQLNLPVEGLRIVSTPQPSFSSVFADGKQTTVYSYTVALEAAHIGDFVIPPIQVQINGQNYASQPLRLRVVASDPSSPPPANAGKLAFLWVHLPKTNLYINEPMVADFLLYVRSDAHRPSGLQLNPEGSGLTISKLVQGQQYQRRVGNAVFTVVPLSASITPLKTGPLSINPLNGSIVVNNRDPMDIESFFGGQPSQPQQVPLTFGKIDLQVSPLPTVNVPPGFNGAVGAYSMSVTAGPTTVVAGDPITLRVQITGRGSLDSLALPDFSGWNNFKTYPPTSKINANDTFATEGSKTFEQIVTPQNSDIRALPPISFSFFDPEQRQYRTLTQPAIPLVVRAATPGAMPAAPSAQGQEKAPTADVVPLKQHIGALAQISPPLIEQPWFLVVQSVPALALISCVILRKRKESLANNPRLRRQRQVAQVVREGLLELHAAASENDSNRFFATLFRLLQEQLGERLDMPASAITEAVVDERLRPMGVSEETCTGLHELFQTCNLARYAPIESSQELAAIIPRLETVLNDLKGVAV